LTPAEIAPTEFLGGSLFGEVGKTHLVIDI